MQLRRYVNTVRLESKLLGDEPRGALHVACSWQAAWPAVVLYLQSVQISVTVGSLNWMIWMQNPSQIGCKKNF